MQLLLGDTHPLYGESSIRIVLRGSHSKHAEILANGLNIASTVGLSGLTSL